MVLLNNLSILIQQFNQGKFRYSWWWVGISSSITSLKVSLHKLNNVDVSEFFDHLVGQGLKYQM